MASWLKLLIFILIIGISRAHHIKLVLLAALGLAGVWMMQTYTQGSSANGGKLFPNFSFAEIASKVLTKRTTIDEYNFQKDINWEVIIMNDSSTCARSFICQIAATPLEKLKDPEIGMLEKIINSRNDIKWANKELLIAMRAGIALKNREQCRKFYNKCPFTVATMLKLLKMFAKST